MKVKILSILVMIAASLLLLSCITSKLINVEISCDQFNQNPNAKSEFTVEIGDKITITLCSNPTTGYQWDYEIVGEDTLMEEDHDFQEPEDEELMGAPGKDIWTFEATDVGTAEIRMEYSRSFESSEQAEWTYVVYVTVQEYIEPSE